VKKPKAKTYIDGANIFYTQKKLGWSLDWQKIIVFSSRKTISWELKLAASEYIFIEDLEKILRRVK